MPIAPSQSTDQDADDFIDGDEIDEAADPFEILAAREEAMGTPLYFMNNIEVH